MEYLYPRYLEAKKSVDDRALNQPVWKKMAGMLARIQKKRALKILEFGSGTGAMPERLVRRRVLTQATYLGVDSLQQNVAYARLKLPESLSKSGWRVAFTGHAFEARHDQKLLNVDFIPEDVYDYIGRRKGLEQWDIVLAHAFLDLFNLPEIVPALVQMVKPGGLAYFSLNFDGLTLFEPEINPGFDRLVLSLYHESMDRRLVNGKPSGDSQTGRHLYSVLLDNGIEVLEAGSSDWIVMPRNGEYPLDEAYFLHFIINTIDLELRDHPALEPSRFANWIGLRHWQVDHGELFFIAHQVDYLARIPLRGKIGGN